MYVHCFFELVIQTCMLKLFRSSYLKKQLVSLDLRHHEKLPRPVGLMEHIYDPSCVGAHL
jgi:hypothetical protein